jgi:hypothetical protein
MSKGLPVARPLLAADLPALCLADEKLIRKSMKQGIASIDGSFLVLIPDIQTIRWHHAREEFVGLELHGRTPEIKGAIVDDGVGRRVWCYWTRMWYNEDPRRCDENTLHILRLVVEAKGIVDWELSHFDGEERRRLAPSIAALLALAQQEAAKWNLEGVEVWNPNSITIQAARLLHSSLDIYHRDSESIPSLRWNKSASHHMVWLGNEKYGWC